MDYRVQRPKAHTPAMKGLLLVLASAVGLGLGLLCSRSALDVPRHHSAWADDDTGVLVPDADDSSAQASAAALVDKEEKKAEFSPPSSDAVSAEQDKASAAVPSGDAAEVEKPTEQVEAVRAPPAKPEKVTPAPITIALGRIAYFRCDHPSKGKLSPCPRDKAMEQKVWRVVESIPQCATAPRQAVDADLRLDFFQPTSGPTVKVMPVPRGAARTASLNRVTQCLERRFILLRSQLKLSRLIVSFKFSVQS